MKGGEAVCDMAIACTWFWKRRKGEIRKCGMARYTAEDTKQEVVWWGGDADHKGHQSLQNQVVGRIFSVRFLCKPKPQTKNGSNTVAIHPRQQGKLYPVLSPETHAQNFSPTKRPNFLPCRSAFVVLFIAKSSLRHQKASSLLHNYHVVHTLVFCCCCCLNIFQWPAILVKTARYCMCYHIQYFIIKCILS